MINEANEGLKFIFENCVINFEGSFYEFHFHNKIRFEFHNCKFKSDKKLFNELIDVQMELFRDMNCCELKNYELYIRNEATNESLEIASRPEPTILGDNKCMDDKMSNYYNKTNPQYQQNDSDLLKSSKGLKFQGNHDEINLYDFLSNEEEKVRFLDRNF